MSIPVIKVLNAAGVEQEVVDARGMACLPILNSCAECKESFIMDLMIRRNCDCYLRKQIAEQKAKKEAWPWWLRWLCFP